MKTKLLLVYLVTSLGIKGQNPVPNSSFETWSNGSPSNWTTNNVTGVAVLITQSNDANSGAACAKLEPANALGIVFPPGLNSASDFTVSSDYGSFSFYYKCNLTNKDQVLVQSQLKQNSTVKGGGQVLITGPQNTSVYTQATGTYTYISAGINKINFSFAMIPTSGNTLQVGSYVLVDDVSVGASTPTGINDQNEQLSSGISGSCPNPAQGITLLPFEIANAGPVNITLYNMDGKKVMEVLNEQLQAGRYKAEFDASLLEAGMYVCVLNTGGFTFVSKIACCN